MLAPIPYSLTRLAAVQEQRKRMDRWKERFSKSLCRHFNNVFISLGNEGGEGLGHRDLHLPLRTRLHQELLPYSKLMHWLKQEEPKNYQQLQSTYTCSLQKLYQFDCMEGVMGGCRLLCRRPSQLNPSNHLCF